MIKGSVRDPDDVDDLVHDCLERLLSALDRLDPQAVLPFGIVTARHLVISRARRARSASLPRPSIDPGRSRDPQDAVVQGEARTALIEALGTLSATERDDLVAYQLGEGPTPQASDGATRIRMARTRAKVRLEYLLALRRMELPTSTCRRVLLAVSAGDTRRQRALGAGDHLLDCGTCAELCVPLESRSLALAVVAFPLVGLWWLLAKARAHPIPASAATATAAAVIAGVVVVSSPHVHASKAASPVPTAPHRPAGPRATSAPRPTDAPRAAAPTPPVADPSASTPSFTSPLVGRPRPALRPATGVAGLDVAGVEVRADSSLRSLAGRTAVAEGVTVVQVVTHNGFWIGRHERKMVWVEFVGPRRRLHVADGDTVRFTGTVVADPANYPTRAGLEAVSGSGLLATERAHVDATTTSVLVRDP